MFENKGVAVRASNAGRQQAQLAAILRPVRFLETEFRSQIVVVHDSDTLSSADLNPETVLSITPWDTNI